MNNYPPRFDDLAFLSDPMQWPNWPVCPVKRYHGQGFPDTGIIIDGIPNVTVYLVNLWELNTPGILKTCKRLDYASLADLIADGWLVD